jgi:hypothetical protein
MTRSREIRRHAGVLAVALTGLALHKVEDVRGRRGRRWPLSELLTALFAGMVAGCTSLADVEALTTQLSPAVRRKLRIWRRVPDTTLRDMVMRFAGAPDRLRQLLHRQTRVAHRRKQLAPDGLPCGVVAIDGKHVATKKPDDVYAQQQGDTSVVRSLTATLTSGKAAACIDACPIPKEQSESSALVRFVKTLLRVYGALKLFEVITADAGIGDEPNARFLDENNLGYIFAIKDDQPTLSDELHRLLGQLTAEQAEASTTDRIDNQTVVIRRVWRTTEVAGYHTWSHLRTGVRVQSVVLRDGVETPGADRFFATNLPLNRFTPEQWLKVIRGHWRVENDTHKTWDVSFNEDRRPWLIAAGGMLVIQLLRRVAYNALVLYRDVSRRGEHKRAIPWKRLLEWFRTTLTAATLDHLDGLRWPPPPSAYRRPPPWATEAMA